MRMLLMGTENTDFCSYGFLGMCVVKADARDTTDYSIYFVEAMDIIKIEHHLGIADLKSQYFRVKLSEVQTNIVIMYLDPQFNPKDVQKRMATIYPTDPVKVCVKCSARDDWIRFVTCWEVTAEDTRLAIEKILFVLKKLEAANKNGRSRARNSSEKLERAYIQTQAAIEAQNKKSKL